MARKRAPHGHWKEWKNVEKRLKEITKDLGHFPIQTELFAKGHGDVQNALSKYHGGINQARERMGYEGPKKPNGYWEKWENVAEKLNPLIEKLGRFPTQAEITEHCGGSILSSIRKHHGGLQKTREKFGHEATIKPYGYWREWENVKGELERIIGKIGHFPFESELRKSGNSSLGVVITNYYGGIRAVRERMGHSNNVKEHGYWKDFKNLEQELKPIIEKLGHFPTQAELKEEGAGQIKTASSAYHGGLVAVRERMGYSSSSHERESQKLETLLDTYIGGQDEK